MTIGPLAFISPWLLAALLALPILYWLLRTVPPTPKQITFPPTRILVGLENQKKMPARSPWWLTLLRMLAATLVILALAEPLLNPTREQPLTGAGPVVVVVDNGWASAAQWDDRLATIERVITNADANSKSVVILPTAFTTKQFVPKIEAPLDARASAAAIVPQPFDPDREAALSALRAVLAAANFNNNDANVVWLSDGISHKNANSGNAFANSLSELAANGTFTVFDVDGNEKAIGVAAGLGPGGKLIATVKQTTGSARSGILHAFSAKDERLGEARFIIPEGSDETSATFELPLELRNQVTRVTIADVRSAGAVTLLDARTQRQRIALLSGESLESAQPLLAPLYYLKNALEPFAEVITPQSANLAAGIEEALEQKSTVIMLANIGRIPETVAERISSWIKRGGIFVRFAGPRLEKGGDSLLPVQLREGGRTMGGALSWSTPQTLAQFDEKSAFVGLTIPEDVLVNRQVLADPSQIKPETQIWARLQDGTPLVTAAQRGQGQLVLFHITANSDWSSLPISGLFVEMLQRISSMGGLVAAESETAETGTGSAIQEIDTSGDFVLAPQQTLDGFGVLQAPPPTAQPISNAAFTNTKPKLESPPGYYGTVSRPRALNVLNKNSKLRPLSALPTNASRQLYKSETATPLKPWMFLLAFTLIILDMVAVLILQAGGLAALWRKSANSGPATAGTMAGVASTLALSTLILASHAGSTLAQQPSPANNSAQTKNSTDIEIAMKATRVVTFGYVLTGDLDTDETSRIGLKGLSSVLDLRTAVSPGEPIGVDIAQDEIAYYPVLYWPVLKGAQDLPETALAKIDAYMKKGGMIIFDTRDHGDGVPLGIALSGSSTSTLQRLLGRLDIPRLEPVSQGHVLTKSFYLLSSFPGRWDGGELWAEAASTQNSGSENDGVTSLLITSNDFASAWALDQGGRPLYPVVPGGEPQREIAFRTGINIVMHALTGNYKADQVHVPALLERIGQ